MRLLPLLALLSLSPGCTILKRGLIQDIRFESDPPGAAVSFHGKEGITPCELKIPRSRQPREVVFVLGEEELRQEVVPDDTIRDPGDFFFPMIDGLLILPGIVGLATGVAWDFPTLMRADFGRRTIALERPEWDAPVRGTLVGPGYWDDQ